MLSDSVIDYIATRNVLQLRELLRRALPDLQPTLFGRRVTLAQAAQAAQRCPETGIACSCETLCDQYKDSSDE